ncbi:MAG: Rieske (2Fe-2S) protein [bacterium]|nr:Rieske (2Fe-2S) protein [bacterium]
MKRKDFLAQVGIGAALVLAPVCFGSLTGCKKTSTPPTNVDFTIDVSTGALSNNGGFLVKDRVIVARTNSGTFLAVATACTHEGTTINYNATNNNFVCPNHNAMFNSSGAVTQGPANSNLTKYNTTLTGTMLRVFT